MIPRPIRLALILAAVCAAPAALANPESGNDLLPYTEPAFSAGAKAAVAVRVEATAPGPVAPATPTSPAPATATGPAPAGESPAAASIGADSAAAAGRPVSEPLARPATLPLAEARVAPPAPPAPPAATRDDPTVPPLALLRYGSEELAGDPPARVAPDAANSEGSEAPAPTGVPSLATRAYEDLWDRIRAGFALPEIDNERVRHWEAFYLGKPDYLARIVERARRYLFHVVDEIDARGMPLEIALLPMIESAFNPVALSKANASGIWQFVPDTGRRYGMAQNWWYDARRDVVAATAGALDYLRKLHGDFGDWQLALAAYNCGEGCVAKAVERNVARGKPTGYEDLVLPGETRHYLPKLQAVKNIVRDPRARGVALASIPNAPYLATVTLERTIDVSAAARLAGLTEEEFRALNPAHNRPVIGGADEHTILLPRDRVAAFTAALESASRPLLTWQPYTLKSGERLEKVAARFGLGLPALREANGIGPRHRVGAGHTLLVPARLGEADPAKLDNAVFREPPIQAKRPTKARKTTARTTVAAAPPRKAPASSARSAKPSPAATSRVAATPAAKPSSAGRKAVSRPADRLAGDGPAPRAAPAS